jgi:DNA polymerase-3 subunit delta'
MTRRWLLSWQRVRGHDALIAGFRQAVQRDRLAHAYLFIGPAGVGKRLFAGELARALLCEGASQALLDACDRCPACLQVEAGTHPDCFTAERPPDSPNLPIEVVRELCRNLALKPARGRRKIAILDDADDLNDPITLHAAANAFLKTLEEPPPGSVLFLLGTSAEQQLSTIISRCQVIRFAPLPAAVVADILRRSGVDDSAFVEKLTRLSDGSPGTALALADPALWEFRRTLLQGFVQPRLDSVGLARAWMEFIEGAGKESAARRRRASLVTRLLVDFLSDALRQSVQGTPRRGEAEDRPALEALGRRTRPEQLLALIDRCLEADAQIDRRVQLVLILEALLDALGQKLRAS